ncbi:L-aspartate oxidase [Arthrobacter sp. JSM 101049]|uniref:L-aspartate oxidase n=1 Tax=Arthrobacter sp. JSM 101049 TaxID=929097 RepID=UPI0035624151
MSGVGLRPAARELAVVGSGVAGLYAAITAVEHGHHVTLLTKDALEDSNSWYAQGGISGVGPAGIAAGDSVASHIEDTLVAGARLNHVAAVRDVCTSAWGHIERLAELGTAFDQDTTSTAGTAAGDSPALGLEAAHAHARIVHAGGDATGRVVASALIAVVRRLEATGRLDIREHAFVTDLVQEGGHDGDQERCQNGPGESQQGNRRAGRVTGLEYLSGDSGPRTRLRADVVLLATGGIGSLYTWTTNPAGATADGAALAWRAGAVVADAEFVQFHPTLVPAGRFMVSEAVRGEGAVLVDGDGRRFMPAVHPDAELAPRDVVARAIHRLRATGGGAYLDARAVEAERGAGFLARRFPAITARLARDGMDLATAPVPVAPAQHYWMGGVSADACGRTTVPGLRVAGETACTGTHGANRLASNSLLEALVHGFRAASTLHDDDALLAGEASPGGTPALEHVFELMDRAPAAGDPTGEVRNNRPGVPLTLEAVRELATAHLGVERTGEGLALAASALAGALQATAGEQPLTRADAELRNLTTVGRLIAEAALARAGSIGAHYRLDAPVDSTGEPGGRVGFVRSGTRTATTETATTDTADTATTSAARPADLLLTGGTHR